MAILVEGFTLVFRVDAIDARYPGGWDGFLADRINERICWDDGLAGVACGSRRELRAYLGRLAERGLPDAAALLGTTEMSGGMSAKADVEAIRARQAATTEVALVYRFQERWVPWLEISHGPLPGGRGDVCGCFLAGGPRGRLALPAGWTIERAVDPDDEPGDGDEYLLTWHEFVAEEKEPEMREYLLAQGPGPVLAWAEMVGETKPFAGRIRPGGKVIEQERVERGPDGRERAVVLRWVKL